MKGSGPILLIWVTFLSFSLTKVTAANLPHRTSNDHDDILHFDPISTIGSSSQLKHSSRRSVQYPSPIIWATITFSADEAAKLFINGKLIAESTQPDSFTTIRKRVRRNDVISVLASSRRRARGLIIDVFYSNKHFPGNSAHWKSHKFRKSIKSWKLRRFSSCSWQRPLLIQSYSGVVRAEGFPYKATGAKYVWARQAGKGSLRRIFMRHVVGGENCPSKGKKTLATISFTADNRAWLFLNGRLLATNFRPKAFKTVKRRLKRGDVIAVGAKNMGGAYGVIVDVLYKGRHFSTGRGYWKAHKYVASWRRRWRLKSYSSCHWQAPVPVNTGAGVITSRSFPYSSGARYVWASPQGQGMLKASLLRLVIGGEKCVRNNANGIVGQSEGTTGKFCRCRVAVGRTGTCYEMHNPTVRKGRCSMRDCETKYECVGNTTKGTKVCIKRIATEKVLPSGERGQCVKVQTNTAFFVPYQ